MSLFETEHWKLISSLRYFITHLDKKSWCFPDMYDMNKRSKCHKWRNTFLQAEGNVTDLCDKSKSSDIYSSIYFWIACLSSGIYLANVCFDALRFMFIWLMTHVWSKSRTRSKFRNSRLKYLDPANINLCKKLNLNKV